MLPTQNAIESKEVTDCYELIATFFDAFPLPDARLYVVSSIRDATQRKIWRKAAPVDLLYFMEEMEDLLHVAFTLTRSGYKRTDVLLTPEANAPDIMKLQFYCGRQSGLEAWDYFPRHLSKKEYYDPYEAIKKVCSWKSESRWKDELKTILYYALGKTSMFELSIYMDVLKVNSLLNKLVEAAHLIHVRTSAFVTQVDQPKA